LAKKKSSAEKRHRQSEERRMRNKAVKSSVRTSVKKFVTLVQKKEKDASDSSATASHAAESEAALKDMIKKIDTAARKGIIKKNAAARKKSRMQRFYNNSIKAK
jgi:small subunit ribosomal protein S20